MATKNVTFQKAPPTSQPGTLDVKQFGPSAPTPVSVQWGSIGGVLANQADLQGALNTLQTDIDLHEADHNNPHVVTKAQVGLGNADNTSDALKPVSGPQQAYIDAGDAAANANANSRVLKAGDTMTGDLTVTKNTPRVVLNRTTTNAAKVTGQRNGVARWDLNLGDATSEAGSDAGSNFTVGRYNDAGTFLAYALAVGRANGFVTVGPGAVRTQAQNTLDAWLEVSKAVTAASAGVIGNNNGVLRWIMRLGNNVAESGSNAGSDFQIEAYSDAGASVGQVMRLVRRNGAALFGLGASRAGALTTTDTVLELSGAAGTNRALVGNTAGVLRWSMNLGDSIAETGTNAGSNFSITPFSDAGAARPSAIQIWRSTGAVSFGNGSGFGQVGGVNDSYVDLNKNGSGNNSVIFGTNNGLPRWAIELGNGVAETGGNNGSIFGINRYNDAGGYLSTPMSIDRATAFVTFSNRITAGNGYMARAGDGGALRANTFNIDWTGSAAQLWIDTVNQGTFQFVSDERIKKDIIPMPDAHSAFMAIRPIEFSYRDISIFRDDGRRRRGFSVQQLQACGFGHATEGSTEELQENGDPQPASVQDRPILAQAVLEIQALHALVAELRAELDALKAR